MIFLKKNLFFLFLILLFVFNGRLRVNAESYDLYVDEKYDKDDSDGSKEKPYKSIAKALEKGGKGKSILAKVGKYTDKLTLEEGTELYGEDKNKTIIQGTVTMKNKSSLEKVTVQGGSPGIFVVNGANVEIENCVIKNAGSIGIQAEPGKGKLRILKSSIHDNGLKGFYIQAGREIEIAENEIYSNKGEGIDIRANVDGIISKNNIYSNSESGIEFVVGSSDFSVLGNMIKKNGASAVAGQFYEGNSKTGKVSIRDNTLSDSRKYALDCAFPSGGDPSSNYWEKSIDIAENKISGNKLGPISKICHMAIDKEEAAKLEAQKLKEAQELKNKQEIENSAEAGRIESEKENKKLEEIQNEEIFLKEKEVIEKEYSDLKVAIDKKVQEIESRTALVIFFIGPNYSSLKEIKNELINLQGKKDKLVVLKNQFEKTENQENIQSLINEIDQFKIQKEIFIKNQESRFSLFGWIWS